MHDSCCTSAWAQYLLTRQLRSPSAGVFLQSGRATRLRVPPLAFWANERISRTTHQTGGFAVEQGFSDQLAQACHGLAPASPAKKAKKVTDSPCPRDASFIVLYKEGKSAQCMHAICNVYQSCTHGCDTPYPAPCAF